MKIRSFLLFWLFISLAFHVTTILSLKYFSENKITREKEKPIEVIVLDDLSQTKDLAHQIVEQDDKQVNDETDPNAKYLSQFNQKVVKQTKAQLSGKFNNNAGLGQKKTQSEKKQTSKTEKMAEKQEKSNDGYRLQKFMPKMDWTALAEKNSGGNGKEASRSSDYLKDVDKGMETQLSTKQFLYYAYFKRIHVQIQSYWEASIKEKIEKLVTQGRNIASEQNRVTKLLIILDSKGTLVTVKVLSESGYRELDNAGVDAFKTAAPFPNPPAGLVEKDGTVRIRYDFVLES
jgi:TonB family protein